MNCAVAAMASGPLLTIRSPVPSDDNAVHALVGFDLLAQGRNAGVGNERCVQCILGLPRGTGGVCAFRGDVRRTDSVRRTSLTRTHAQRTPRR